MVATEPTEMKALHHWPEGTSVLFVQPTPELEAWLKDREANGRDRRDEVWEGIYVVMTPHAGEPHEYLVAQTVEDWGPRARARKLRVAGGLNVGRSGDFRIPDVVVYDVSDLDPSRVWIATVKVAVEIRSPGEPHEEKLPFYAAHRVGEVVLIDPGAHTVRWLQLSPEGAYESVDGSDVLGLDVTAFAAGLQWE